MDRLASSCLRVFVVLIFGAGCVPKNREQPKVYTGPTLPLAEVVSQINQNNGQIKSLWARGNFECDVRDNNGKQQHVDGDTLLLVYRKPGELHITGRHPLLGPIFDIGSNVEQFWLWIPMDQIDTIWWGEQRNAARVRSDAIPIQPDLLIEVLGINDLDPDLLRSPIPALRFNNEEDAYVIDYHVMLADRMIVQKEVWYDRATLLPRLVLFYEANGRLVMRANLLSHKPVQGDSQAKIATEYRLHFLQTGTKLVFKLEDLKESYKGKPDDRSFRFPGADAAPKSYKVDDSPAQQPL